MIIDRESYNGWKIEFLYAPLFEMFCSLHVLFRPGHHKNREEWALETKEKMTNKLYETLSYYDELTYAWDAFMDYLKWDDIENGLDVIGGLYNIEKYDDVSFIKMILRDKISEDECKKFLMYSRLPEGELSEKEQEFLLNHQEHKAILIASLKEYFYIHFHDMQIETEAYMIRTLKAHKSLSQHMDFLDYMDMLHPRIEICEDRVSLHKYKRIDMYFDQLELIHIRISTFIDPHLWVNYRENYLLLCIRAKMVKEQNDVHEDLVGALKALGDKSRLRIVKHLYNKPCSTQELAILLDISEAGVSKHLKLLFNAKVIKKVRKGNYILYFLDQMAIDMLPMNVYQYLDE